jgi:NapC/NirT cytochrome c family protein
VNQRPWLSPIIHLSNNWISFLGVLIVTTSTVFWLFLLPSTLRGEAENPYIGILSYMGVPAAFFLGLLLIPLGIAWSRRRELRQGRYPSSFPPLTLQNPELRRLAVFIAATTFVNLVVASQVTYAAVTYMDQVKFCGTTCHTVMKPEYTAHQDSPHSRVECVVCHIGAGAGWFVRSKLSGAGQVIAVALNNYPRPIPTPVRNLRPARETCETCHWPQKYGEDRLRVFPKYGDDAANTLTKTVMLLKIGGGNHGVGIHGTHLGPGVVVRYAHADEGRQTIPWVEYNNRNTGRKTTYMVSGTKPDAAGLTIREMDCRRPGAVRRLHISCPAVRQENERRPAEKEFRNDGGRRHSNSRRLRKILSGLLPCRLWRAAEGRHSIRPGRARGLQSQRFSRNEGRLGLLSQ